MPKETSSVEQENLFNLLSNLTGHLKAANSKEEKTIQNLQKDLADVLVGENIDSVKNNILSYENSDLFFTDKIPVNETKPVKRYFSQDLLKKLKNQVHGYLYGKLRFEVHN